MSYIFYRAFKTEKVNRFTLHELTSYKFRTRDMLAIQKFREDSEYRVHGEIGPRFWALKLPEDLYAKDWICSLGGKRDSISSWPIKRYNKCYMLFYPLREDIDLIYGCFKRLGDAKQHILPTTKVIEAYTKSLPVHFIEEPKGEDYGSIWESDTAC